MIKFDVYDAIQSFFEANVSISSWNKTAITLIPKIPHASQVKDYSHISCCSVMYKIVAKILAKRLHKVSSKLVSHAQAGFIPGRAIVDNVMLASELIKGYTFSRISPRCLVKVDMMKANDSVD